MTRATSKLSVEALGRARAALHAAPEWRASGYLLPSHMRRALSGIGAPGAICSAVGARKGTTWDRLPAPTGWTPLTNAVAGGDAQVLLDQPVMDPAVDPADQAQALVELITTDLKDVLPLGNRARNQLVQHYLDRPLHLLDATVGDLLHLRSIGIVSAIDISAGLNAGLQVLLDLQPGSAEAANPSTKTSPADNPVYDSEPIWAAAVHDADPRFIDLLPPVRAEPRKSIHDKAGNWNSFGGSACGSRSCLLSGRPL